LSFYTYPYSHAPSQRIDTGGFERYCSALHSAIAAQQPIQKACPRAGSTIRRPSEMPPISGIVRTDNCIVTDVLSLSKNIFDETDEPKLRIIQLLQHSELAYGHAVCDYKKAKTVE
jgi:hypothetical protein